MINDNHLYVQRVNFWEQNRITVKTDLKSILISIFDSVHTQIIIIWEKTHLCFMYWDKNATSFKYIWCREQLEHWQLTHLFCGVDVEIIHCKSFWNASLVTKTFVCCFDWPKCCLENGQIIQMSIVWIQNPKSSYISYITLLRV